ncbi:MAG TPA: hypothetical protein VLG74_02840 [Blastocatellia bacterium]|nr:hypothetical protein [Blastocatellia bacterium]
MRDATLREAKATLRGWFAGQDDGYLMRVVAECRAETFGYWDACHCLLGCLTEFPSYGYYAGLYRTRTKSMQIAENALYLLGAPESGEEKEPIRCLRTLPLVLAEIRRRTKSQVAEPVAVHAGRQP